MIYIQRTIHLYYYCSELILSVSAMLRRSATRRKKWITVAGAAPLNFLSALRRGFRSASALKALQTHIQPAEGGLEKPRIVLYNYPSFSGAFGALFAYLYHSSLKLPCLVLPFSSVEPLRVEDFRSGDIDTCYLLDFAGRMGFAGELAKIVPRVVVFDHRLSERSSKFKVAECPNLKLLINTKKSSVRAALDYFSEKYSNEKSSHKVHEELLNLEDQIRMKKMITYIEDIDLRRRKLVGIKEFEVGIREVRSILNTITNPNIFKQLLKLDADDLIAKGNSHIVSRLDAAKKLIVKPFILRLGRGLYGECLAVRADGNAELSHEIAVELSTRSAAAGLRPIGAVIFMQRRNLKMCLRTTDSATDTSLIAKACGGGGKPCSSSFMIRMDEYNQWTATNSL